MAEHEQIAQAILACAHKRGAGKTMCPSDVARAIAPDTWRALMPNIRAVAVDLAEQGHVVITQKGVSVDAATARGPIRIGLATS